MCTETYGFSAEVVCTGNLRASIPYIPIHIDYMCAAEALVFLLHGLEPVAWAYLRNGSCRVVLQPMRTFLELAQSLMLAAERQAWPGEAAHLMSGGMPC